MFHNRLFHFLVVISETESGQKYEVALRYSWNEMNRIINKYWTVKNKQKQIENFSIHLFGSQRLPTSIPYTYTIIHYIDRIEAEMMSDYYEKYIII